MSTDEGASRLRSPANRRHHRSAAPRLPRRPLLFLLLIGLCCTTFPAPADQTITLSPLGTYNTDIFDESAAEIAAYDPASRRLFVVNGSSATIDVLDMSDPASLALLFQIDVTPYGRSANSVAATKNLVAIAIEAEDKTDNGRVVFYDGNGTVISSVEVGALPDMLTFSPNKRFVLVANEGEPSEDYQTDPEGTVTIIDIADGAASIEAEDVLTVDFTEFNDELPDPAIRIFGPGATAAQDLEPEYIAVSRDSRYAAVSFQENNALALINVKTGAVIRLFGLRAKNHALARNALDASDRDNTINITTWPVHGMYQPDAIAMFHRSGTSYVLTANEGDVREWGGYDESARVADVTLDPVAFPDWLELQRLTWIGRMKITTANGDVDNDGDFDTLYSFGARSFSIWTTSGELVYDSGSNFAQITAAAYPDHFNCNNDENWSLDRRSDDKGCEPEGITVAEINGRAYAFIGLERIGGIMVYDITNPRHPQFVEYVNNRDFEGNPFLGTAGDLGTEGLLFIPTGQSPTGTPLLVTANEVSGSTTVFEIETVERMVITPGSVTERVPPYPQSPRFHPIRGPARAPRSINAISAD